MSGGHPSMDYAEHTRTYKQFILFSKVGTAFVVVLLAGMYWFLV
jgi:Bacterial aa3 type cytochrome c oxidase subunit IV